MTIQTDVLIVGGGFAGVSVAQALEKQGIHTTLVDQKEYFEVTFATLRNLADPGATGNRARKHYKDFLKGRFIQSRVQTLGPQRAVLSDGAEIRFKHGIIASGTRYPGLPIAKTDESMGFQARNNELMTAHTRLKKARKVMIIGGGVVGVELAGEIAHAHPHIQLILAHNSDVLLNGFKQKAQARAQQQLKSLGVEIEFNRRYQKQDDRYIDQNTGHISDADLVYEATGVLPNNDFLKAELAQILNAKGFVKIDKQLQVEGISHLYALGDIAEVGEARLGYLAVEQGKHLARVIANKLEGKAVKAYKRNPLMALIPVGQKQGVVQFPFAVTTAGFLVGLKQKDLFINKIYKGFGTTPNAS
ncbi:NAD(P)/FAD-dependent oxidoreductase [Microbulbifer spongiae]|uniref:FAD-dependent oxidoreductase n=1 Tax=Microbulbifer spongiae TaxID=2944933 RepID=A0ABY9EDC0_9GAMM|nr:FAD-dependent oxidoreductase [Microbulbifer sp. MI-G]WKD49529.1 FAD-dependent oxidoreductase [Microbulbifer sp. MI-G]